jgi:hypothetical protein
MTLQHPMLPPWAGADAPLYVRTDIAPETVFQAIGRLRKEARDEIERLLDFLDSTENHMAREDDEDGGDLEPSLCGVMVDARVAGGDGRPFEDREDDDDGEPSLGSTGHGEPGPISYTFGAVRAGSELVIDCEGDEHDGCEPSEDAEPSLGSSNDYQGRGTDYEHLSPAAGDDAEGPDEDLEPSLCGVGAHVQQGFGNDQDREAEAPPPPAKVKRQRDRYLKRTRSNVRDMRRIVI